MLSLFRLYAITAIVHRIYAHCPIVDSHQTVNTGPFKHWFTQEDIL